jgi:signal peptidase II
MLFYIITIIIVALDQFTKYLAVTYLQPVGVYKLIPGVFQLSYAENTGAAFSIFNKSTIFLAVVSAVLSVVLIFIMIRFPKTKQFFYYNLALSFMLGGAIGNLIDRVFVGYVVDFFDFNLINFAIFNVADSFVVIGAGMFIILLLFKRDLPNI